MLNGRGRDELSLEAIGLSGLEERAYRALLDNHVASAHGVAESAGLDRAQARAALASLEAKGIVSRMGKGTTQFAPASPELAFEPHLLRRQEELDRARLAARELEERFRARGGRRSPSELVEVVGGQKQVAKRFRHLQLSAKHEVVEFDKPPYAVTPTDRQVEFELLARGIRCRTVYDLQALEQPGVLDAALSCVAAGEEARVHEGLPTKLAVADRKMALLPLSLVGTDVVEAALLIRSSSLLETLMVLFETWWDRAAPLRGGTRVTKKSGTDLSQFEERLAILLLTGVKDRALARQLGVGFSTVGRGVKRLMDKLGATTRFQAGYHLAERRLLEVRRGGRETARRATHDVSSTQRGSK